MKSIANTTLNLGLVSAPVKIFKATEEQEVKLNLVGPKGEALRQVYVIMPEQGIDMTGDKQSLKVVSYDNIRRAFGGRMIDSTALANVEEASSVEGGRDLRQIHIDRFIPLRSVPFERITGLYYLGPNRKIGSAEPFMTIMRAMKKKRVAGVAKVVLRGRQRLFVIFERDGIVHMAAVTFASDVRDPDMSELVEDDIKVRKPVLDVALQLIEAQLDSEAAILDEMRDTLVARKRSLIEASQQGEDVPRVQPVEPIQSPDLLEQLKESVAKSQKKTKTKV